MLQPKVNSCSEHNKVLIRVRTSKSRKVLKNTLPVIIFLGFLEKLPHPSTMFDKNHNISLISS